MDENCTVRYFAARTVVNVSGVVSEKTWDADIGKSDTEWLSQVALGTQRDPGVSFDLSMDRDLFHDRKFDLRLAPDQRLIGASAETTGLGYEIIAAGMSIAALVSGFLGAAAPSNAMGSIDDAFASDDAELALLRGRLRATIAALRKQIREAAAKTPPAADALKALEAAMAVVLQEAVVVELQFQEWRDRRFPIREHALSYTLGTDELLWLDTPDWVLDRDALSDSKKALVTTQGTADGLGVIVARIGKKPSQAKLPEIDPKEPDEAIHYRRPMSAQLAVYKSDGSRPTRSRFGHQFNLCSVVSVMTVDSFCEWGEVPLPSPIFSKSGAVTEFGDQGALTRVANWQAGPLTAVTASSDGSAAASLNTGAAGAAAEAAGKAGAAPDPTVAALEGQVTSKELEGRLLAARKAIAKAAVEAEWPSLIGESAKKRQRRATTAGKG